VWQVTLRDPVWHVSACSGEAYCKLLCSVYLLYLLTYLITGCRSRGRPIGALSRRQRRHRRRAVRPRALPTPRMRPARGPETEIARPEAGRRERVEPRDVRRTSAPMAHPSSIYARIRPCRSIGAEVEVEVASSGRGRRSGVTSTRHPWTDRMSPAENASNHVTSLPVVGSNHRGPGRQCCSNLCT